MFGRSDAVEVGAYRGVQLLIWSAFLDSESTVKPKQISSHLRPSIDSCKAVDTHQVVRVAEFLRNCANRQFDIAGCEECQNSPPHAILASPFHGIRLSGCAPDLLQESVLLRQSVERIVALAHSPHETTESVCLVLAGVSAVLVNLCDGDLDRGVVLGLDDAVGCAALAGNVAIHDPLVLSPREDLRRNYRSTSSPRSFSISSIFEVVV